jgi:RNA polymerase sigma-70 factor (ECF subfamily)
MSSLDGPDEVAVEDVSRWVDAYGDALFRFALARVRDRSLAEDLVQETFLAAWKSRDAFRGECAFSTWLTGILRRKVVDHFRREQRNPTRAEDDGAPVQIFDKRGVWKQAISRWAECPGDTLQLAELGRVLGDCVERLPPNLAEAFLLRERDQLAPDDVCRTLQISRNNLSVRLHRARLLLRHCLELNWFDK